MNDTSYAGIILAGALAMAPNAGAVLIAGNDFEDETPSDFDTGYRYDAARGDGSATGVTIPLPNHGDEGYNTLNSDHADDPARLGFSTSWTDTRPPDTPGNVDLGMSSAHYEGVTDAPYLFYDRGDGLFFKLANGGGLLRTAFETVDLSGHRDVTLTLDLAANDRSTTAWGRDDAIAVYVETNAGRYTLFSGSGPVLRDDPLIASTFLTYSLDLPDSVTWAVLYLEVDSNAGSEYVGIDNIAFEGVLIPEPASGASLALMGLGGTMILSRRRRA